MRSMRTLLAPFELMHSSFLTYSMIGNADVTTTYSFFNEALRIGEQGYVPTETDVLRARQKSTGITETRFNMGQLSCVCYRGFLLRAVLTS
jgi:hypothetical protein